MIPEIAQEQFRSGLIEITDIGAEEQDDVFSVVLVVKPFYPGEIIGHQTLQLQFGVGFLECLVQFVKS